jgi:hypothetical protein
MLSKDKIMNDNDVTQIKTQVDLDSHPTLTSGEDILTKHVFIINGFSNDGGEAREQMGEYILKYCYNDDVELASSRKPNKGIGIRELAKDPDIEVSFTTLNRSVRTAVQSRFLKEHGVELSNLSYSTKLMLLVLRNDTVKAELAKKIEAESLSRSQVEAMVNEKRKKPKPKEKLEEKPVSKIDQIVGSLQALREIDINPVMGEIAKDRAALDKLRGEAAKVAEWVAGLIREIGGNCATGDTVEAENG